MDQVPEMKLKKLQEENAPLVVEQEQNLNVQRDLLFAEQEQFARVREEEQADPLNLYRERTAGMKDTAELGTTSFFKNKTEQQRMRNQRIKQSKKLTSKATAYTLEIHTQLHDINDEMQHHPDDIVLLRSLEQYPFLPQMFVTSMIRANFKEYVMLVRNFEYLDGQNKKEYAERLGKLAPVISALRQRLSVYCEQNRVSLAGDILSNKEKAAALTKDDIENWYGQVAAFNGQQQADVYNPDDAKLQAAEQKLQKQQLSYDQAKSAREQVEDDSDADNALLEELQRQEQREFAYYRLAQAEANLARAREEGQDGEELRRQAREIHADIRRLERRQAREEMGGGAQTEHGMTVRRTREEAIATPSDQLSFQSRERLAGLNRELNRVGMAEVAAVVERYVEGTRYRVGYTKERELLQAAIGAVRNASRNAQTDAAAGALTAISEYFDQMTNGTLEIPADAEIRDFSGQRPMEEGTVRRGGRRNAFIRGMNQWSDQKDTPLFAHEPTVNDLKQRLVSNCYMVASTAGLVNLDPALLKDCIRDNGDGTVTVRLYEQRVMQNEATQDESVDEDDMDSLGGFEAEDIVRTELVPIYVKVTKEIPRIGGMDALSSGALWMQMIEKACAFVGRDRAKGYQSLWYGQGGDFLERLLGVAPEHIEDKMNKSEEDALFENICHAGEQGYVYNTGTPNDVGEADGLNAGHAYTIMGGKVVNGERYVLMRNPYSTHSLHYEDDGSKTRTGWLLSTSSDETYGQFYIKFEDFRRNFKDVSRTNIRARNTER